MAITYTRIDGDTVRQTIIYDDLVHDFEQSEAQKTIDDTQTELDNMPAVKPYPVNATPRERNAIDEWNTKHSNKFEKENMQSTIDGGTAFLNMLKAVT